MKKILSILSISIVTTSFSTTTISCNSESSPNTKEDIINDIEDKIESSNNSIIRGDNLSNNVNDELTKKTILNTIGLTDEEKTHVEISGALEEDSYTDVTYDIYSSNDFSKPYTTKINKIMLERKNIKTGISGANNISLFNNKQLVISNLDNDTPISDIDLNFTSGIYLNSDLDEPTKFEYVFNNKIYGYSTNNLVYREVNDMNRPDNQGNYFSFYSEKIEDFGNLQYISSSNNHLYGVDSSYIKDITDDDNTNWKDIASDGGGFVSLNAIWNLDGTLYVGTDAGLYVSIDNGTSYTKVPSTNGLDVTSIISDSNNEDSKIFLGTATGLYVSNYEDDGTINFEILKDTDGNDINGNINQYSFFIDNKDILYYGVENGGLWSIDLSQENLIPSQIITNNIEINENIKSIVQYYDGTLILLTNKNIVYLIN